MSTFFINTMNCFDVALSSDGQCQICQHPIQKGQVRYVEIYWNHCSDGINRRYYHDSCALVTKVTFQNMPPSQQVSLEQQRTRLIGKYSEGRLLLAERRDLYEMLERLNLPLGNSPITTSDMLEDITINLPSTSSELVRCLHMTPSLVQDYGTQILSTIQNYRDEQPISPETTKCAKRRTYDAFCFSSSPVTTAEASMNVMMGGDGCSNGFLVPPPPPPLTNFRSQPQFQLNVPTLLPRTNNVVIPQCGAFEKPNANKRMKSSTIQNAMYEQRCSNNMTIQMMTD